MHLGKPKQFPGVRRGIENTRAEETYNKEASLTKYSILLKKMNTSEGEHLG